MANHSPPTAAASGRQPPSVADPAVRVVGIGASAGGLEAFLDLLSALPSDTGLAFVLVQHLDPEHDSMLVSILAKATAMPVVEVTDAMPLERDHVYVIPPGAEMTIQQDVLRLVRRSAKVPHRPLDSFFCSLAAERARSAVGVVLSGNGADGAFGLQAIRDAGGSTFAQTPESAKFDAMPRAAASAADLVLPAAGIAEQLVEISRNGSHPGLEQSQYDRILQKLRERHSIDFTQFKRATVERRILRRVQLGDFTTVSGYADSLDRDVSALEVLYQDLLIGVTSFFREPERFESLKSVVFPVLLNASGSEGDVRIWAAGCSTGEEVYSLGMTLLEFLDGRPETPRISIFGTDINEKALAKARSAVYSEHALEGVSPERLARFFTPVAAGYKVAATLRDLCVFAAHDLTKDPPYSRINLTTCCNVLIYFDSGLQKKAIAQLEYALVPGGFLMLGSSENLRGATDRLVPVSGRPSIYRKPPIAPTTAALETAHPWSAKVAEVTSSRLPRFTRPGAGDADDSFLAGQLAPRGVLVNEEMAIVRIRGDVAPFIALEPGNASLNLFELVRHAEMLAVLRPAVRRAFRERTKVMQTEIMVVADGMRRRVMFDVIPRGATPPEPERCWVLFYDRGVVGKRKYEPDRKRTEIESLRQALEAAVSDREELADEAASAAEEAQSSDEELRSANEELETAKEELQSANEELSTLNDELRLRNTDLLRINDDIENLLGAVEIPILFVGLDLHVRRFNRTAGELLHLHDDAVGRPLSEARSTLDIEQLGKLATVVMETGEPLDEEVTDTAGNWRVVRLHAYRTRDGAIDGAIIAIVDINDLKRSVLLSEEATRAATMLSTASALLASSLDYETTLESVAGLSTAAFADWCAVDLIGEDGSMRHLTVSHVNPVLRELVVQFQQAAFLQAEQGPGAPQALRLRKSVLLSDIAESKLTGTQPEAKITQLIGALGVRSLISVPLMVRDRIFGTMTFSSSRRRYDPIDLRLAEELSQRAAVAIDTALLFREAENANRYKDAFLGTVAHELRTPLTSVLGWVQLAKLDPAMVGDALTNIDEAANLLRVFIEDLLDVARIREKKLKLEMKDVDLADVVRLARNIIETSARSRQIGVTLDLGLSSAPVRGDSVRLLQVLWNLLSNAVKFTPAGGEINLRLERAADDVRVVVRDNGAGISAEFVPHVFELYSQGERRADHLPGLGIGLSIVAQIVSLHEGTVRAESEGEGRGSIFIVTLPLRQPVAPVQGPERMEEDGIVDTQSN
ncbi:MAG: chemotaxis protein CheB [Thermoanaerobaculia bacterium]